LEKLNQDATVPAHGDPATAEGGGSPLPETPPVSDREFVERATELAASWQIVSSASKGRSDAGLPERLKQLANQLEQALSTARQRQSGKELTPQLEFLESSRALEGALKGTEGALSALRKLPHVRLADSSMPRIIHLAETYLD